MNLEEIKKEKKKLRTRNKEIRTCFWTRPWGHWWIKDKAYPSLLYRRLVCHVCKKSILKSNYPWV